MNLTITLDESTAERLKRQASTKASTPEQTARELLEYVLRGIAEEESWQQSNQRRIDLIRKSRDGGLTTEEGCELDRLQSALDRRLAPVDRELLAAAERFRQLAERLPDATAN